jgi:hypothetical protein
MHSNTTMEVKELNCRTAEWSRTTSGASASRQYKLHSSLECPITGAFSPIEPARSINSDCSARFASEERSHPGPATIRWFLQCTFDVTNTPKKGHALLQSKTWSLTVARWSRKLCPNMPVNENQRFKPAAASKKPNSYH